MKKPIILISIAILIFTCQKPPAYTVSEADNGEVFRIMFWNVENLFDTQNDSLTQDDEFLPHGERGWTLSRYKQKINNMYKVFIAAGDWDPPDLIGLCEIENKNVLFDLIKNTPFSFYNYRFIHHDSPDRRGIDVAILYNPKTVEILYERAIPICFFDDTISHTRDILHSRLIIHTGDTLTVFVNHWPSKYGGAGITADLRESVAKILSDTITKILKRNPSEKIIVMGDFNDPPESSSLNTLTSNPQHSGFKNEPLMENLALNYSGTNSGSYKFEGSWELIDQVLVSKSLVSGEGNACVKNGSFRVFTPSFLLENDDKFGGTKPNRTYTGYVYHGGFSDHLPVILDLFE